MQNLNQLTIYPVKGSNQRADIFSSVQLHNTKDWYKGEVYRRLVRKKEQKKIKYNRKGKMQYFILDNLILLKYSTYHFEKLIEWWCRPFIINNFDENYSASNVLKTLDRKPVFNTHYGDHLRIFYTQEKFLCLANEEPLVVIYNLRFRKKKDWNGTVTYKIHFWLSWRQQIFQKESCKETKAKTANTYPTQLA